jgi:DNA-binding NarL/FixJ family response regulator
MVEERPWRPALTQTEAARALGEEAEAGRLDRRASEAVLEAAGRPRARRRVRGWPAGLTDREVDVLRRLARGGSNKEIARQLHVSAGTVHTHVINLYGKIEVNTRAGAALFALEHDLIQL